MLEIAREEAMIKQGVCMFSRQNKGFELRGSSSSSLFGMHHISA